MKIYLACFNGNNVIDIVSAETPKEAYKNTGITDNDILSDITMVKLSESNIEKIESLTKGKQKDEETIDSIKNQIEDIYENQLTDEQFKEFAFDWIGAEALVDYIDDAVGSEMNIDTLKQWLNETKEYLNIKQ